MLSARSPIRAAPPALSRPGGERRLLSPIYTPPAAAAAPRRWIPPGPEPAAGLGPRSSRSFPFAFRQGSPREVCGQTSDGGAAALSSCRPLSAAYLGRERDALRAHLRVGPYGCPLSETSSPLGDAAEGSGPSRSLSLQPLSPAPRPSRPLSRLPVLGRSGR